MSLPETIPLRREPQGNPPGPGLDAAWMGALVLLALLLVMLWKKLRMRGPADSSKQNASAPWKGLWLRRPGSDLTLVSSARLTQHHTVHEVEWRGRRMLIGCAGQSMQLLGEMPLAAQVSTAPSTEGGDRPESP